ncbi:MAG: 16S rRNA (guanine(966)-N(2))-methyltransferase RsmD [Chloroflexi bacterium]|nr:16S rRNA (guanine(966)-N(2))-methyltransferase RsmD [Chloroflexota bacterium]
MRITGGSAKGQILKTLPGLLVRPTTDRVREAIFSMLSSLPSDWDRGLDLFAGTGALGIEALSREAGWIDFVDRNSKSCKIIKQNLEKTGFSDQAHVYCCPVIKALGFLEERYGLIFLDPPYADTSLGTLLTNLSASRLISADSLIIVSHASRSPLDKQYNSLSMLKEKRYGDTCISIYRKEVAA